MSEFQYVAFRAIDRPVEGANLKYMQRQSSRAEVTPWSFENEYHHGDFGGNAMEMLRRGYDIHLHYANFGIRKLLIRLPQGMPNVTAFKAYSDVESLRFKKDREGPGGILSIEPFHEPGDLEELWELDGLLERLAPLRGEIMGGDLRPLYLAHLAVASDSNHDPDEAREAPVPAGLGNLSGAQAALAELYGLDDELLAAAALESPPAPSGNPQAVDCAAWLRQQPESRKNEWLAAWLADPRSSARDEMLAECRGDREAPSWPTVRANRTIVQLESLAEEIAEQARKSQEAKDARQRAARLAKMAKDPLPTLRETERLVAERSGGAYRKVAEMLAELREALANSDRSAIAELQAQKLKAENPTLNKLVSDLRRQGFLPKARPT